MSSRIHVLSPDLIAHIAAGEVVERPASVVKELVENALDAGAGRILIEAEGGGLRLIRVADDGGGMTPEEAPLALVRHATSKVSTLDDLARIRTLGFRGEALASIAAVSRLSLSTRSASEPAGVSIRVEGGGRPDVRAAGAPRGTDVGIRDLFFNTPARRKFLKSEATETARIVEAVTHQSLARPEVTWELRVDGRLAMEAPACGSGAEGLRERATQLLGRALGETPRAVDGRGAMSVAGLVCRPEFSARTRAHQHLFINRRPVSHRGLLHAVYQGYGPTLAAGRHPAFVLWIEIDPQRVDANVHPSKREVRLADESAAHDFLAAAVARAVGTGADAPAAARQFSTPGPVPGAYHAGPGQASPDHVAVHEPLASYTTDAVPLTNRIGGPFRPAGGAGFPEPEGIGRGPAYPDSTVLEPLGQIADLYLLARSADGLVIIDQHAAAERVLYETILRQFESGGVASQGWLMPVSVDLAPAQHTLLEAHRPALARLGFDLEPFGPRTVLLKGAPAFLPAGHPGVLTELLDALLADRPASLAAADAVAERLASAACRKAVRASDRLAPPAQAALLRDLLRTARPLTCPHGRPTMIRITLDELRRKFGRS